MTADEEAAEVAAATAPTAADVPTTAQKAKEEESSRQRRRREAAKPSREGRQEEHEGSEEVIAARVADGRPPVDARRAVFISQACVMTWIDDPPHRRPGQSGREVRAHPPQRGLLVGGRDRRAQARRLEEGDEVLRLDHARRGGRPRILAAQARDVHERERPQRLGAACASSRSSPRRLLVVHDELDLPPGVVKLKRGGGTGGHNGLEGHRRRARHQGFLAPAHRHRPPGRQGPRRRLRAAPRAAPSRTRSTRRSSAASTCCRASRRAACRMRWPGCTHRPRTKRSARRRSKREPRVIPAKATKPSVSHVNRTTERRIMSLQCGIVGLPNVGKSTLFNALTKAGIAAENYPFCTIEPNVGIVEVPDPRLKQARGDRQAAEGDSRRSWSSSTSRAWSPARRRARAWATSSSPTSARPTPSRNVVRCFEDGNVIHVNGKVDPIADIEVINTELALADMQSIEKA